ncbi:MAG: TRAP transporter substrate-binding protein DctP [Dehalococcoidales bacterium]|nr:TRAP transporter substrate-binding protein DctP [Dehalococcoidales bacterium]
MATSWAADSLFYTEAAAAICDRVGELSGGRFIIEPKPAGEIAGALEVMDAVWEGHVEMGHSWSGYWLEKDPAFELFSSIPGQMVAQEWEVWMYGPPKGVELWQELYSQYNIVVFPGGMIGPEFGFFTSRPVRTLDDFRGLKLRVSGLAAEVVKELGATSVMIAPDEIKAAMQSGNIDGFEFSTPAVDWPMGFQEVAQYVCLPSWHQPSAVFEAIINKDAYNRLPDDMKAVLEAACKEVGMVDFMTMLEGANAEYLSKFEQYGTQISILDSAAIREIIAVTNRLADEKASQYPFYERVLKSQRDFINSYRRWETWADYRLFSAKEDAERILSLVRQQITDEIVRLENDIAAVAKKLTAISTDESGARSLLRGLLSGRSYTIDAALIDSSGKLAVIEPEAYRAAEGSDVSEQEQVKQFFNTQQPVLSYNFKSREGLEAAVMAYPVFSSGQIINGAVSVLLEPAELLGNIISEAVDGTSYQIWVMQPDGLIIYDVDMEEVGVNLFTDPLYEGYDSLVNLGKGIAVTDAGIGEYSFLDTGMQKMVSKQARWETFKFHGTQWKLILIEVQE